MHERGLLFLNPQLFVYILKKYIKEKGIYWPDIFSRDDREVARAIEMLVRKKLSPAGWLPTGRLAPKKGKFFTFFHTEIGGRSTGIKPFIPLIMNAFCKDAQKDTIELVKMYKNSPLYAINIILN